MQPLLHPVTLYRMFSLWKRSLRSPGNCPQTFSPYEGRSGINFRSGATLRKNKSIFHLLEHCHLSLYEKPNLSNFLRLLYCPDGSYLGVAASHRRSNRCTDQWDLQGCLYSRVRRRSSVQGTSLCITTGRSTILPMNRTCWISTVPLHWMVGPLCCITAGARATRSGPWARRPRPCLGGWRLALHDDWEKWSC